MLILLPVPNTTHLNALQGCKFITSWAKRPQPQEFACFQGRRESLRNSATIGDRTENSQAYIFASQRGICAPIGDRTENRQAYRKEAHHHLYALL